MKLKLLITLLTISYTICKAQTTNITQFRTLIKSNHNISLVNPAWDENSLMTYNQADIDTKGGAFSINFTNNLGNGGSGYKGYPNASIGAYKGSGTYIPGVLANSGMPIQISNLKHNLRMKWKVSQLNANDSDDKWWASINVIFDKEQPDVEPNPLDRDYDLVIELNRYQQEDFQDVSSATNQAYWYYARNADKTLKTLDFNYNGTVYSWVVRYKFANYPAGNSNEDQNNKVHVKFTPLFNSNVAPFLDHSLKKFIDTSVEFLQNVNLTTQERTLAQAKVGDPNLYIKNINAGYEVYTGNFTAKNDYFYTVLDTNPPSSPTNLIATETTNQVNLDWDDNTDSDFNTYKIYRAINGGAYSLLAENINVSNYLDTTTATGNEYSYYVVADDRSYNVSTSSNIQNVTIGTLSSVNFEKEIDILIYPNPIQNTFAIESKLKIEKVELYSLDGKLITIVKDGNIYRTSNLSTGIYNLKIKSENKIINKKVIVK